MPIVDISDGEIYYEVFGKGFPVMTFAPAGPRSSIASWRVRRDDPRPARIDPINELADDFMVIAMDQRQTGQSRTTVGATDSWHNYAGDALAVMDAAGVEKAHMLGCCIGPSFSLAVNQMAPERVVSQVVWNPAGYSAENHGPRLKYYEAWIKEVCEKRPDLDEATMLRMRDNLLRTDFVYSVDREFVRHCDVPMLVMPGDDPSHLPHPPAVGEEVGELAPRVEMYRDWKYDCAEQKRRMLAFLHANTPSA